MNAEFELIERIKNGIKVPAGITGIGDDCAIIPQQQGLDTLVTADLLVEGRHFLLEDANPEDLGWKSAAVNISDIAAMGGRPLAAFLSIALPSHLTGKWADRFAAGFKEACSAYGVSLLGGDTSASDDKVFINVTLLGQCPHGKALKRSGAVPGDIIFVSGPLGDSAAGLKLILEGKGAESPVLTSRHYRPEPRVELGQLLAATPGIHAMMDISDGVAADLPHILEESRCGASVDTTKIPVSQELKAICKSHGWPPLTLALDGGEDYQLLFTAAPGTPLPQGCTAIGTIEAEPGLRWLGTDRSFQGFKHF